MGVSAKLLFILRLDHQRYALDLATVERVVRMVEITPLPQAPDAVLGVINLQGRIIDVLDLRMHLQLKPRPPRASDLLVIASSGERTVALISETVGEIACATALQKPEPGPGVPSPGGFVTEVMKVADGLVLVCDLDRLLDGEPAHLEQLPGAEVPLEAQTDEELRRLLRERARRLAQEPAEAVLPEEQLELVLFLLGRERYGIETAHVREVYPYRELVRLPGAPSFVMGIMNVRGKIHSVVDLRRLLELPAGGAAEGNKVIFLQGAAMSFGVMAEAILGVQQVALEEVQPALATHTGIRAAYVKGVTPEGLTVLDAEKMLSDRKLVVHQEV